MVSIGGSLKAFREVGDVKTKDGAGGSAMTLNSMTLVKKLSDSPQIDGNTLKLLMDIGDYNGMDVEAINKKIDEMITKNPKEVIIALGFGVKNGGVMDQQTLDRYSGADALRSTVAVLGLYTKTKGVKAPIPKNAITISRLMTFLHPICIDLIVQWKIPAAAGVDFPLIDSHVFKSTFGPYCYLKESDPQNVVYLALLEWNIAHHDQVNPQRDGATRPKFNKTIFDLKIRTSAMDKTSKKIITDKWAKVLMGYSPGSTYPDAWERNGQKKTPASAGIGTTYNV